MSDQPDLSADYERLESEGGSHLGRRDVIEVSGPEAGRYLQGQLSQDVVAMVAGSAWSLLLQPNGKVDAWLRLHRRSDDEYVLDVDEGAGEAVAARLRRYLLRTKADITDPRSCPVVARRRPAGTPVLGADDPPAPDVLVGSAVGPGVAGDDLVVLDGTDPLGLVAGTPVADAVFERYRIAHAVPAMGAELTEDTIPAEAGSWLVDASASFTKGCYTGQELVARIDSRGGNVPRPIRLLVVDGGAAPEPGAEVRAGDKAVGAVTSAAPALSGSQPVLALARVGRSAGVGDRVEVDVAGGRASAVVAEPPFRADAGS